MTSTTPLTDAELRTLQDTFSETFPDTSSSHIRVERDAAGPHSVVVRLTLVDDDGCLSSIREHALLWTACAPPLGVTLQAFATAAARRGAELIAENADATLPCDFFEPALLRAPRLTTVDDFLTALRGDDGVLDDVRNETFLEELRESFNTLTSLPDPADPTQLRLLATDELDLPVAQALVARLRAEGQRSWAPWLRAIVETFENEPNTTIWYDELDQGHYYRPVLSRQMAQLLVEWSPALRTELEELGVVLDS